MSETLYRDNCPVALGHLFTQGVQLVSITVVNGGVKADLVLL